MVCCVHFQVVFASRTEMQRGSKMASAWRTGRSSQRAGQNPSANTRNTHATQCLICLGAKCKSAQVFRLNDGANVGRELDKSKTYLINTPGEGFFFYRLVMKIRVVASGWLGRFASDKCVVKGKR